MFMFPMGMPLLGMSLLGYPYTSTHWLSTACLLPTTQPRPAASKVSPSLMLLLLVLVLMLMLNAEC
jgi:hypothetical protein